MPTDDVVRYDYRLWAGPRIEWIPRPLTGEWMRYKDHEARLKECPRCNPVRPKIVCLCGSTRFWETFHEVGWQFTVDGWIVLSIGVVKHAEHHGAEALGQHVADRLDELHFRKIDLCDAVFVINVGGYVGESTRKEIEYAKRIGRPVIYLEDCPCSLAKEEGD